MKNITPYNNKQEAHGKWVYGYDFSDLNGAIAIGYYDRDKQVGYWSFTRNETVITHAFYIR